MEIGRMRQKVIKGAVTMAVVVAGALAIGVLTPDVAAQQPPAGGRGQQPPATPRAAAPVDLTGIWVAVITEDWRFRMVTPPKGDFASLPLNAEGRRVGNAWDLAKDIAAGEQCKAFGAPGLMRMPIRLRISWENDTTLKVESDNGQQVRLFSFQPPGSSRALAAAGQPSWQGVSVAQWETAQEGRGLPPGAAGRGGGAPPLSGSLKVLTTNLRPGYLRRNGAPYSGQAVYTEFFDRVPGPNNESWLIVTSVLDDPTYLAQPFNLTTQFKREPDASKFSPRPCEMTPPVQAAATAPGAGN
jgi:hypothetical protein